MAELSEALGPSSPTGKRKKSVLLTVGKLYLCVAPSFQISREYSAKLLLLSSLKECIYRRDEGKAGLHIVPWQGPASSGHVTQII